MIIIKDTINFKLSERTAVSIGKFDGIHKGHGKILKKLDGYKKEGLKTAVFSFDIPPNAYFSGKEQKVLLTPTEKRRVFEDLSVDYLIEFPFNEKTAATDPKVFVEDVLLDSMQAKVIVCGDDISFGSEGRGNLDLLRSYEAEGAVSVCIVDKETYGGEIISSSRIRSEIVSGSIEKANRMLLMPYMFYGEVVHGRRLGRTIGMPTVNLLPEPDKLMPDSGVYYSGTKYAGRDYRSITNIGVKPTVVRHNGKDKPVMGVETYIYDFDREIYGDELFVSLYHFVRPERKFSSVDALKAQMKKDIEQGREWHGKHFV
ncbi:MAG: bifunctional riboflavin kinase/FAD synthetase [Lachnospiraceae bacterium]|nr:bifunctional riboflavin kinase/FAD synthetase [Lachnospiraceae bacterium]